MRGPVTRQRFGLYTGMLHGEAAVATRDVRLHTA
jgi:hypothetical protein